MTISVAKQTQVLIDAAVASGRYDSPEAVVEAGVALLADRDEKLAWLRNKIQRSIEVGGSFSDEEVGDYLDKQLEEAGRPQAAK